MIDASLDVIEELKKKIAVLEEANKVYKKLHNKLMHEYPEKSGRYFISGESGDKDRNGLPEAISVCPAYGADFTVTYVKIKTEKD